MANLFTGRSFMREDADGPPAEEEADRPPADAGPESFRRQARHSRFDEAAHFAVLAEVPVVPRQRVEVGRRFLAGIVDMLTRAGTAAVQSERDGRALRESEADPGVSQPYLLVARSARMGARRPWPVA